MAVLSRWRGAASIAPCVITVLGCAAWSMPARAQTLSGGKFLGSEIPWDADRGRNIGVLDRSRAGYAALGIHAGGFTIFPRITFGVAYTDNVYGERHGKNGDFYFSALPSVTATSNWSRHALRAEVGGEFKRFTKETPRNEDGFHAETSGRLDIGDNAINARARIERSYQEQYAGDFPVNAKEAVQYTLKTAELRGTLQGVRFRLIGSTDVNRLTYRNVRALDGSVIDEKSLDRNIYRSSGRVEYAVSPDTAVFVQLSHITTRYDRANAVGGFDNRDSEENRALAGATFDISRLVRGRIGLGYTKRKFDSPQYKSVSGLSADISAQYFLTQLTTITANLNRAIGDSAQQGSGGYLQTAGSLRVDHELLRNLLLNVNGSYGRNAFRGVLRTDRTVQFGGGANYLANRRISIGLTSNYLSRRSTGTGGTSYDELRLTGSVTLQM